MRLACFIHLVCSIWRLHAGYDPKQLVPSSFIAKGNQMRLVFKHPDEDNSTRPNPEILKSNMLQQEPAAKQS